MIHWEARSSNVACTGCFSSDTRMLFEFLAFTRHVCRACGQTFVTVAQPSNEPSLSESSLLAFPIRRHLPHHQPTGG
jgi:hypothetical protein